MTIILRVGLAVAAGSAILLAAGPTQPDIAASTAIDVFDGLSSGDGCGGWPWQGHDAARAGGQPTPA